MSWNSLSHDITLYILSIRNSLRNHHAMLIQRAWRNVWIHQTTLCTLIPKSYLEDRYNGWYTLENKNLACFMKFISRYDVLKFKKYISYWMILYDDIEDQILKNSLLCNVQNETTIYSLITKTYFDVFTKKINNNNYIRLYY